MKNVLSFLVRWVLTSLGLWVAVRLFGREAAPTLLSTLATFALAGLIFAIVNAVIKPLITILSLPFVLVTLGLFMLVINGFMVWLTILLVPNLHMNFGWAIVSGIILSLVNYIVSNVNDLMEEERGTK